MHSAHQIRLVILDLGVPFVLMYRLGLKPLQEIWTPLPNHLPIGGLPRVLTGGLDYRQTAGSFVLDTMLKRISPQSNGMLQSGLALFFQISLDLHSAGATVRLGGSLLDSAAATVCLTLF